MSKARLQAAMVGGTPDDTEQAFYEALNLGDIEQLMSCWADEEETVCVHPGGPRLIGAGPIRETFEAMFAHGPVRARPERIHRVQSLASAVHHLVEHVQVLTPEGPRTASVIATNLSHTTPRGWRLVAHHASPGPAEAAAGDGGSPAVLH
ncbi:MAG: YybH family protein [Limnohabitans sp.]